MFCFSYYNKHIEFNDYSLHYNQNCINVYINVKNLIENKFLYMSNIFVFSQLIFIWFKSHY